MKTKKLGKDELVELMNIYQSNDISDEELNRVFGVIWISIKDYVVSLLKSNFGTYFANHSEEMLQEASIAVFMCLKKFNPEKGSLTTWIKAPILHSANEFVSIVVHRTTPYYGTTISKILKCENELRSEGLECNVYNIADRTNLSIHTIENCKHILDRNQELHYDGLEFSEDVLPGSIKSPEESLMEAEEQAVLHKCLNHLSPKQREIIDKRFGFSGNGELSVAKIADDLGCTKEMVKSDLRRAMNTLEADLKRDKMFDERRRRQEFTNMRIEIAMVPMDSDAERNNAESLFEALNDIGF